MTIHEFLARPREFRWGGVDGEDCMTFCASWIAELTGIDPAAEFRGTYHTEFGAGRLIASYGGLVPLTTRLVEPLGFTRTTEPQPGDVGIIKAISETDRRPGEMAAIRFGPLWAAMSLAGVRAKKVEFVAAWRAPLEPQGPLRKRAE